MGQERVADPAAAINFDRGRRGQVGAAADENVAARFLDTGWNPGEQRFPSWPIVGAYDPFDVPVCLGGDVVHFLVEAAGGDKLPVDITIGATTRPRCRNLALLEPPPVRPAAAR